MGVEELCPDRRNGPSMIEPLLCGIVLGLIPVTLAGLFVAAWNQYRRGTLLD
jgi:cytochrome b6-f complex subunit 5